MDGFVRLGDGGGDGRGAEARFVRKDAARNAALECDEKRADCAAAHGGRIERTAEDVQAGAGQGVEVAKDQHEAGQHVEYGHERHDDAGDGGYALEAAHDDGRDGNRHDRARADGVGGVGCAEKGNAGCRIGRIEGGVEHAQHGGGDAVDLNERAEAQEAGGDAEDAERDRERSPAPPHALFDVLEGPADHAAVRRHFTVADREQTFGILGGHAEDGGHFHPEKGPGTAGADGGGHAHDVAGADGGGERRAERGEVGHLALRAGFVAEGMPKSMQQEADRQTP